MTLTMDWPARSKQYICLPFIAKSYSLESKPLDIQAYIDSGVVDEYCAGALTGERLAQFTRLVGTNHLLAKELHRVQQLNKNRLKEADFPLSPSIKSRLFAEIQAVDKSQADRLSGLDLINPYSDIDMWKARCEGLAPKEDFDNIFLVPIRQDAKIQQFAAWVKSYVEEEVHTDLIESFILLNGNCTCQVGEISYTLSAGDFLEIPLFSPHSVEVSSDGPVHAILQRIYL